ncbi:MAG TPA: glycosyltransferase, partial [Gemmatimonadaceae bacterium]|nr:glycosyltransferase [Gemmatimonadaceae bacterium]
RALNQAVAAWVGRGIPESLCVIWATGAGQYDAFKQFDRADVRVVPYLSPIGDAYAASDLAFVRGGMMTASELCAWGVPMIICPLPTAAMDHQTSNALALEKAGAAVHLAQRDLTADSLDRTVRGLIGDPARMSSLHEHALGRGRPHAAEEIAGRIVALLHADVNTSAG